MAGEVHKPHDHLFRSLFGEQQEAEAEAASLLQVNLPPEVSGELLWSSLKRQSVSFIDDRLRDSESDLLYAIRRKADGAAAWLYVLLEHQPTPDPWLRLRLLKYSIRIWERDRRLYSQEQQLRPIVPLVLYPGRRVWREAREFAGLFAEAVRDWPGVPSCAHLEIRRLPGGEALMSKTEEMIQIYREIRKQEGRREAELRGTVRTIEQVVGRGVPWSMIEAATGIDEASFDRLRHQLDAADGSATAAN